MRPLRWGAVLVLGLTATASARTHAAGVCRQPPAGTAVTGEVSCADGDPCTRDTCGAGACEHGVSTCPAALRVNVGGPPATGVDLPGLWSGDTGVCGPHRYFTTAPINGTRDDLLFQTEVYGKTVTCALGGGRLAAGTYRVTLYFAEIYFGPGCPAPKGGVGARVFDVALEGETVLKDLDVFAEGGCAASTTDPSGHPVSHSFLVPVTDGTLDVRLTASSDNAKLSAIEVAPVAPGCTIDAGCGLTDTRRLHVADQVE